MHIHVTSDEPRGVFGDVHSNRYTLVQRWISLRDRRWVRYYVCTPWTLVITVITRKENSKKIIKTNNQRVERSTADNGRDQRSDYFILELNDMISWCARINWHSFIKNTSSSVYRSRPLSRRTSNGQCQNVWRKT